MGLGDAEGQLGGGGVGLEGAHLGEGLGRVVHAVAAVDLAHLLLQAGGEGLGEVAEVGEVVGLLAGGDDLAGELLGALAALLPMLGEGEAAPGLLDHLAHEGHLGVGVGVEVVEADDGADAGAADDGDVRQQIAAAAGLEEGQVLLGVGGVEGRAGLDVRVTQSGEFTGTKQKISKRGSPYLRRAIWLAASRAAFCDPILSEYYQSLRARGKYHLTAIGAVSRKLCNTIYTILKEERPWQPVPPRDKKVSNHIEQ